jgi:NTE family protein
LKERPRVGLVLSGGGARGAYEVGVLQHVAEHLPDLLSRIEVVTGTSVGAVNAAFLAARGLGRQAVDELAAIWRALALDELIGFDRAGLRALLKAGGLRVIGRDVASPATGVLDVTGIVKLVHEKADWRSLRRVVRSGRLRGVGLAATDIGTGRTHLFVDHKDGLYPRWTEGDDGCIPQRVVLSPSHVLASAAIPLLFPPIRVGSRWYMDGGLRNNTPLAPALALGAERLLIVSVRTKGEADVPSGGARGAFPGFGQMVARVLDSVFLDRVGFDLDRLTRINDIVEALEAEGGDVADDVRARLVARGHPPYTFVPYAHVRPNADLGALASEALARVATGSRFSFGRVLQALFTDDAGTTGDAASFLLFDGGYAEVLLGAGRADAEREHAALAAL